VRDPQELQHSQREALAVVFLQWYRETEARAATHPLVWHRPPKELRERVSALVREIAPEPLPCPCSSCRNMRLPECPGCKRHMPPASPSSNLCGKCLVGVQP
jgi:hypothetical protein